MLICAYICAYMCLYVLIFIRSVGICRHIFLNTLNKIQSESLFWYVYPDPHSSPCFPVDPGDVNQQRTWGMKASITCASCAGRGLWKSWKLWVEHGQTVKHIIHSHTHPKWSNEVMQSNLEPSTGLQWRTSDGLESGSTTIYPSIFHLYRIVAVFLNTSVITRHYGENAPSVPALNTPDTFEALAPHSHGGKWSQHVTAGGPTRWSPGPRRAPVHVAGGSPRRPRNTSNLPGLGLVWRGFTILCWGYGGHKNNIDQHQEMLWFLCGFIICI